MADHPLAHVKALVFDVFGTVVDWRSSVIDELVLRAFRKSSSPSLPSALRTRLEALGEQDWARFADEWRANYFAFCRTFTPGQTPWKTVDQHHRESLESLLREWDLAGAYTSAELDSLSMVWHRLNPWEDAGAGLAALRGAGYVTATLSNGNVSILRDLDDYGGLGFDRVFSAEGFRAYKPDKAVYEGCVGELGVSGGETAMVAAHLYDLQAARGCGMRTIYVERRGEEAWKEGEARVEEARGWVDLWVSEDEEGFVTVAKRLAELRDS